MRTTIDLPDALFARAKKLARKRNVPFRELVEEGLRSVLDREAEPGAFRLMDKSFDGDGLASGLTASDWDRIRDLTYEGRGA
ncbi:MAG: DUF2191 domain-containing protein [Deltaproteobacteria bacterium]|nr:DUF2191 domain-containing protein [Deltaproteobacteria bacterium]